MKRLYLAACLYAALGLLGGLYYRTLTHQVGFTGTTQLSVVHTHFLVLGFVAFLLFLALQRLFDFLGSRTGRWFEVLWHVGLVLTAGMMTVKGTLQVLGTPFSAPMLAGVSGLGHMVMTAAVVCLLVALRRPVLAAAGAGTVEAARA